MNTMRTRESNTSTARGWLAVATYEIVLTTALVAWMLTASVVSLLGILLVTAVLAFAYLDAGAELTFAQRRVGLVAGAISIAVAATASLVA